MTRAEVDGMPVGPFEKLGATLKEDFAVILGIGYTKMNTLRAKLYKLCKEAGYEVGSYISSQALVYSNEIGEGTFVCPGVVIGPDCKLGKGNYIESSAVLTHDNTLGDFNFISTNAVFGGFSKVEDNCFIGLHTTIKDEVTIASGNFIGASANVLKSIANTCGVYIGNPARYLRETK